MYFVLLTLLYLFGNDLLDAAYVRLYVLELSVKVCPVPRQAIQLLSLDHRLVLQEENKRKLDQTGYNWISKCM